MDFFARKCLQKKSTLSRSDCNCIYLKKKAKNPTVISDGRKRRRRSAKFDDLPFFDFEYDYEDNQAADLTGKRKQFIKGIDGLKGGFKGAAHDRSFVC